MESINRFADNPSQYAYRNEDTHDFEKPIYSVHVRTYIILFIITQLMLSPNVTGLLTKAVDYTKPIADRIAAISGIQKPFPVTGTQEVPSDTTPATPSVSTQKNTANQTLQNFPFDDAVKEKLSKETYGDLTGSNKELGVDSKEIGAYQHKGGDIYNFTRKFLPEKAARFIADKGSFIDPDKISISRSATPGTGMDQDQSVMAHEMLHKTFEDSPMGGNNSDFKKQEQAGKAWLSAWDSVKGRGVNDPDGDTLYAIDKHLKDTGYPLGDAYSDATERFAYLGEQALQDGIQVIPKELQPYYYGIIKGAPKPTAEQLGAGLPSDGGFNIDIGDAQDRVKNAPVIQEVTDKNPLPIAVPEKDQRTVLDKVLGRTRYDKVPFLQANPQLDPTVQNHKIVSAIANNETGGVKDDAYSFSQPSGNKALGDALGKYQVTAGELSEKSQDYLGKKVTPAQFLASPELQDSYMASKVAHLKGEGLDDAAILAVHNKGMTGYGNPAVLAAKIKKAQGYVDKGLAFIKSS